MERLLMNPRNKRVANFYKALRSIVNLLNMRVGVYMNVDNRAYLSHLLL